MEALRPGSYEHKVAFCRSFIDTHDPFKPSEIAWPALDEEARARLSALPIWDEAVYTERETALKVQSLAKVESDPILHEAIDLQGYEEGRHSIMLDLLTRQYGIAVAPRPEPESPPDPEWAFMRVGYGECFDSFFAFGLFAIARDSGFFPPGLVKLFDPIMQEEARHILFFVNWVAYRQVRAPVPRQPLYLFRRGLAIALQVLSRIRTAIDVGGAAGSQDNFAMKSHESFGDFSPRIFLERCVAENTRRLAPYDTRLLRPRLVPALAGGMLKVLPRG
jgi:hypothetical protein